MDQLPCSSLSGFVLAWRCEVSATNFPVPSYTKITVSELVTFFTRLPLPS